MKNISPSTGQFKKILFAIDDSEHSAAAVDAVAALALQSKAQVRILHIWNPKVPAHEASSFAETAADARRLVATAAIQLKERGVAATIEIRNVPNDDIAREIADAATQYGADLLALGSRGRSDFGGLLLGSVSHKVLSQVDCPVLVVRARHRDNPSAGIRRVLLAVAGDEDVPHALTAVAAVALSSAAEVLVLHVRYGVTGGDGAAYIEPEEEASALVDKTVRELTVAGVTAKGHLTGPSSSIAREITDVATNWDADLIVMGSRRLSDLGGLLLQSVGHQVLHLTDRPVLVAERAD